MRISLRKWRPGPKSGPEKGPKSGPKTGPPFGSPGVQKHKEFKGFWSFFASQRGPVLGSFLDPFWGQFRDPRISEIFRNLIKIIKAVSKEWPSASPEKSDFGGNIENTKGGFSRGGVFLIGVIGHP